MHESTQIREELLIICSTVKSDIVLLFEKFDQVYPMKLPIPVSQIKGFAAFLEFSGIEMKIAVLIALFSVVLVGSALYVTCIIVFAAHVCAGLQLRHGQASGSGSFLCASLET